MSQITPATDGVLLRFVVHENRQHAGRPIHDWLLQQAQALDIPGGSAYRGIAGFGRHGVLHEARFLELAGDLPVDVQFICSEAQAQDLLSVISAHGLTLFYIIAPVRFGLTRTAQPDS